MTKRFAEQRWALDNIIRANGIDWDQPRSLYLSAPCGVEAGADFTAIRARVQKMADIGPAFESTAKRREAKARAAEAEGNLITARDNWFMAAVHYGAAESGPMMIPARPTSTCMPRSGSATPIMPGSPITRSKRFQSPSTIKRSRPGSICRPTTAAAECRSSSPFPEWTVSRRSMSPWSRTGGSRAALRCWRSTDRANTKARFWAFMFRWRTGSMPGRHWSIGSSASRRWTRSSAAHDLFEPRRAGRRA